MTNTNAAQFRKDMYNFIEKTIKFNEPLNISTKHGNAVLISEADYRGIMESLYLRSVPDMEQKIIDGLNTPLEDCLSEDDVDL